MEISNSLEKEERQQTVGINKKKQYMTLINVIVVSMIFLMMGLYTIFKIEKVIQGIAILTQSLLYGLMYIILNKRKNLVLKYEQKLKMNVKKLNTNNKLMRMYEYLLYYKYFELYFLSLAASLYISIFELMINYHDSSQQAIIISLILSGFANIQSINSNKGRVSFGFLVVIQIYTLLRVQLTYERDIYFLILNILLLVYQVSYLKTVFTQNKKLKINQRSQKSKIELTMRLYQSILSIIPEGLAVINSDRKLLYANPTLKKILQSNSKNDILQILMNIGNTSKEQSTQKNGVRSKASNSATLEISNQIQNNDGIFLVKPPGAQKDKQQVDNVQNLQNSFKEVKKNEPTEDNQTDKIIQQILNITAQCGLQEEESSDQIKRGTISEKEGEQNQMLSEKQKVDIEDTKNENEIEVKEGSQSQILKEKRATESYIKRKSNTLTGSCQIKSLPSIYSSIDKSKSNRIREQIIDYAQKIKTMGNNHNSNNNNNRDSFKNISQNNFNYGTDNSEILSYQGFGFQLQEDDLSIVNQIPFIPNVNKLKSENNTIKANIDQDSVLSFSQKQLLHSTSGKNALNGKAKNNMKLRQKQSQAEEQGESSNKTEKQFISPSTNIMLNDNEKQMMDANRRNHTTSNEFNPTIIQQTKQTFIAKANGSMNNKFLQMGINQESISIQLPKNGIDENSHKKNKLERTNTFTLKLKAKKQLTQNNIDNQIVTKKTDVADILNTIFQGSQKKNFENQEQSIMLPPVLEVSYDTENQNEKLNNNNKRQGYNSNNNCAQDQSLKIPARDPNKKSSFISHLKNEDKELTYLQQTEHVTKLQVKYKDRDLVLQFISVDYLAENLKNDTLVLIIVQDMWQDLLQKKVEDLQKDKMKIFASLSHELRTPLNCSISMLEVLRDEIQLTNPSYVEEYLNPALFSNKLLLNQINDILDFVQMDSGKFKYSFFEFSILGLLKDCQKLINMQAQMKNIEIRILFEQNIPEIICSDPNRIRQIILNFLSNSLKFTKKGYIEIGLKNIDYGMYQLYVKDTGIGITKDNLANIFNFCAKVKYEKQDEGLNNQGCGLGLTISNSLAKGLVKRKNKEGGITVDSVYGEGSTFSIIIQDMNTPDEDGINNIITQFNQQKQVQKLQKQGFLNSKEEDFYKSQYAQNVQNQSSFLSSPTKLLGKKKQLNLINLSQIIYEDDHSYSESPSKKMDPLKFNPKKSGFQYNNTLKMDESYSQMSNCDKTYQQTLNTQQRFDSTAIVEDESEYVTKQYTQPHQFVQHHHNHIRFQEDGSCRSIAKKQKMNSPTFHSCLSKQFDNFSSITNDVIIRQGKTDFLYGHATDDNFPSQKQIDNSAALFLEDGRECKILSAPTIDVQKKDHVNNNSMSNAKIYKTINSFKTQNTDQLDRQRSLQEQEGFTSYIGLNRLADSFQPQSSALLQEKFSIYSPIYQQAGLLDIGHNDEKLLQSKDLEVFCLNPQDIINEIIKLNNLKKLRCKCPQIVIVDDNQFNLYALSKTIQQFSFSCQQISDSLQVIQDLKDMYGSNCCKTPKMIFMDIEMPFKNGYEIATEINQFYDSMLCTEAPVIIACTAYVGQEDRQKAIDSGMDDFINKPILKTAFQQLLINWSKLFV